MPLPVEPMALDLDEFLEATSTDALVVLRDGKLVFEHYDHDATEHAPHVVMSVTKSIVGLLAGILNQRGDLDTEALVSEYVPEIAATAYAGATIRQLLDMRTGVRLDERQSATYLGAANWDPTPAGEAAVNLHEFLSSLDVPHAAHGGPFAYTSANTDLLGWVIERVTGSTFADALSELLWKPMGAADDAYITLDREGSARTTGGLCATARDLVRLGQLMVDGGRRGSVEVIPPAWIDDIVENGDRDAWHKGEWGGLFPGRSVSYRSGWYVLGDESKMLFAMGIHGQNLFVDRANRIVIAKLSSQERFDIPVVTLTHRGIREIRRTLLGENEPTPRP